jgi:2,4-dienoyl-CoA reductase-like NADH-dependent reductase (Old Yellow Enzyme family)
MPKEYKKLFTPFKIGNELLKNRVTMAPFVTGYGNRDGTVSKKLIEHHARLAKSKIAMIVVEAALVSLSGKGLPAQIRIDHDRFIPGLKRLSNIIKDNGAVACIQLQHSDRFVRLKRPVSISGFHYRLASGTAIPIQHMIIEEIEKTENDFAHAALRAKKAGFDLVELHGATGYLLTQFVSPRTNKRTDAYGGSFKKRIRFPIEIVRKIKELCGKDFPIGYRFLADEFLPDGLKIPEAKKFAKELEKAGISYLSVTGGTYESLFLPEVREIMKKEGSTVFLAEEIKKEVNVPVFGNGRITNPYYADSIIYSEKVDAVALARPLFADPDFLIKSQKGEIEKIIKCIDCGNCADQILRLGKPVSCSQWKKKEHKQKVYKMNKMINAC